MSHSSNNPTKPVTKEQLEQFGAQKMARFNNQIHQLIKHPIVSMHHPNWRLDGAPDGVWTEISWLRRTCKNSQRTFTLTLVPRKFPSLRCIPFYQIMLTNEWAIHLHTMKHRKNAVIIHLRGAMGIARRGEDLEKQSQEGQRGIICIQRMILLWLPTYSTPLFQNSRYLLLNLIMGVKTQMIISKTTIQQRDYTRWKISQCAWHSKEYEEGSKIMVQQSSTRFYNLVQRLNLCLL